MSVNDRIKNVFDGLVGSLDLDQKTGFAARKLSVFVLIICIVFIHASWLKHAFSKEDYRYLSEILVLDYLFILLLEGIVSLDQVLKLKHGKKEEIKE